MLHKSRAASVLNLKSDRTFAKVCNLFVLEVAGWSAGDLEIDWSSLQFDETRGAVVPLWGPGPPGRQVQHLTGLGAGGETG